MISLIINCVRHYSLSAENKRPQTPDPNDVEQLATAIRKEKKKIKSQKFSFNRISSFRSSLVTSFSLNFRHVSANICLRVPKTTQKPNSPKPNKQKYRVILVR